MSEKPREDNRVRGLRATVRADNRLLRAAGRDDQATVGSSKHMLDALGFGDGKIKRVVGSLFAHLVSMAISYMLAELCGNAGNPAAGIWFAVASLFFFFVGTACFIEAMSLAAEGKELRQEQQRQEWRQQWRQERQEQERQQRRQEQEQ